jgi:ribosomal protein L29
LRKTQQSFEVGTLPWLVETGGRLTVTQSLGLATAGFAQTLRELFSARQTISHEESKRQSARVSKARRELAKVLVTQRERVLDWQGQAVLNHTARTYLFGAALVPDEAFSRLNHTVAAVAALAHDDGLIHPSKLGDCFTGDSATEAKIMLNQLGASNASVELARAAVISHFQPNLPNNSGVEAEMIALGASADVMGIGLKKIDSALQREIWDEWPDLGFISQVRVLLKGERSRAPRTRPGVLALSGMPYLLRSSR